MMLQGPPPPGIGTSNDGADSTQPHDSHEADSAAVGGRAELAATSGFSEDERGRVEDSLRNSGGNRWPRQETLALLKIRSDMDVAFRDSSLKGPLWDEVSRKLAELGYHRSAKKCKEKFENVYKYHKRTKDGRTSKADGKTYRFFDQLQALEGSPSAGSHHHHQQPPLSLPPPQPPQVGSSMPNTQIPSVPPVVTPISMPASQPDPISVAAPAVAMPTMNINHVGGFSFSQLNVSGSTNSGSSSTSSDDEPPEKRRNRKRKWKEFFGQLMKQVIDKQEELQSKFLDTLERRERDRMAREEAWRMQEMAKMKREHDLLLQERSMVAAKDAAVITFLQKITEQNPNVVIPQMSAMQLLQQQQQNHPHPSSVPVPVPVSTPGPAPAPVQQVQPTPPMQQQPQPHPHPQPQPQSQPQQSQQQTTPSLPVPAPAPVSVQAPTPPLPVAKNLDNGGGGENMLQPSPSRWPKSEINALINLRTTLDTKYQENGPKGPLWEEISAAMRKLGYNRNAKRCKEKWENINKYYKKVKESSKKRPEDSKTCPYFHQLDAIYREKAASSSSNINSNSNSNNTAFAAKPETQMAPIMARPEQQWPLPSALQEQQQHQHQLQQQQQQQQEQQQQPNMNEPRRVEDHHNEDEYDDEDDDDDDEDDTGDYEMVPNKASSMTAVE